MLNGGNRQTELFNNSKTVSRSYVGQNNSSATTTPNIGTSPNDTIQFDLSKRQIFTFNSGFKTLHRKLKSNWRIIQLILCYKIIL